MAHSEFTSDLTQAFVACFELIADLIGQFLGVERHVHEYSKMDARKLLGFFAIRFENRFNKALCVRLSVSVALVPVFRPASFLCGSHCCEGKDVNLPQTFALYHCSETDCISLITEIKSSND